MAQQNRIFSTETNQESSFPISHTNLIASHQIPMNNPIPSSSPLEMFRLYNSCQDPPPPCFNVRGNLSLSLSMHDPQNAAVLGFEQTRQKSCVVPFGPFTGYALVLKNSRFLNPAQQILDGFCGFRDLGGSSCCLFDGFMENSIVKDVMMGSGNRVENRGKNSGLVMMLDEVYRRCTLYCQQMQSVAKSFETVSGLSNAAPYVTLAFRAVIGHFTCLKNIILGRLQVTTNIVPSNNDNLQDSRPRRIGSSSNQHGVYDRCRFFLENPVWRSQRGLPDQAVTMLKAWLFENFLHPYPTDSEKQMLALQTGLSRTQVSNWFINARVRLWKPMVEEMHELEEHQARAKSRMSSNGVLRPAVDEAVTKRRRCKGDAAVSLALALQDQTGGGNWTSD